MLAPLSGKKKTILKNLKSYVKSMVNGGDFCLLNIVSLVSTSVAFVLISVALTEFCAEFECFSHDLTEMLLILR